MFLLLIAKTVMDFSLLLLIHASGIAFETAIDHKLCTVMINSIVYFMPTILIINVLCSYSAYVIFRFQHYISIIHKQLSLFFWSVRNTRC